MATRTGPARAARARWCPRRFNSSADDWRVPRPAGLHARPDQRRRRQGRGVGILGVGSGRGLTRHSAPSARASATPSPGWCCARRPSWRRSARDQRANRPGHIEVCPVLCVRCDVSPGRGVAGRLWAGAAGVPSRTADCATRTVKDRAASRRRPPEISGQLLSLLHQQSIAPDHQAAPWMSPEVRCERTDPLALHAAGIGCIVNPLTNHPPG